MIKKISLILLGLVFFGSAVGMWVWVRPRLHEGWLIQGRGAVSTQATDGTSEDDQFPNDPVAAIIRQILLSAGLSGAVMQPVEFEWNYKAEGEVQSVAVEGFGVVLAGLEVDVLQAVRQALRDMKMESDLYNASAGTVSSAEGYADAETGLVCRVVTGLEDEDFINQPRYTLDLRCGFADPALFVSSTPSTAEAIRQVFAEKYTRPLEEVVLEVQDEFKVFAKGSVRFEGEMGGGMWLAYRDNEDWRIVYDGNGTVPCSAIDQYDFPISMAPECWDEVNQVLVTR